jgi:RimJ/RimL family protein N-acetyltransferase
MNSASLTPAGLDHFDCLRFIAAKDFSAMGPTKQQAAVIAALKEADAPLAFPIYVAGASSAIGSLMPVSRQTSRDPDVIEHICRWRAQARTCFLTVFEPRPETTLSYLTDIVLADPARILFLIADHEGRLIGNIGLCAVAGASAELDNVNRGEAPPSQGFMRRACSALLAFAANRLMVSSVYLHVLHDNAAAIGFYRKLGFAETARTPLFRQPMVGGYKLVATPGATTETTAQMLVRMEPVGRQFATGPSD